MTYQQLFDAGEIIPHTLGAKATPSPVGSGPQGETCRTCKHAIRQRVHDYAYWKCGLIEQTRGTGTDIRLKWPACRQWEPKQEQRQ